ncbi:glutaredoxin-1-like [Conger conger]|uniref:glutaredoxin-1-like n=1 Tax=Conger conger TaxID=82655 RepID=UPI002A59BF2B|nr:glutaredoxin-1-like [Conger conger]
MAEEFVSAKVKGDRVVLFLKPSCPYCVMAQEVLSKYSFKAGHLELVDISGREDVSEIQDYFLNTTGARTVPRVFIGEQCIGGGTDIAGLDESGKLEGMLQSMGALQ